MAIFVALASAATVLAALAFEAAGYIPCELCLAQRWPYYLVVPIAGCAALASGASAHVCKPVLVRGLLVICALAMAWGARQGVVHAGIEWGWWPGPQSCSSSAAGTTSAAELFATLDRARVVPCDEASWRFFGLSFAGWNALIASGLGALALWGGLFLRAADWRLPAKP